MSRPYAEVIGDPVAHSESPLIHNFWLDSLGIDAEYRATRVPADGLAGYFAGRRADPAWRGCNVTIPHKIAALDHVEDRGDVRETIGAINTAFRDGDAIVGTNTDAGGFYAPIADLDLAGAWVGMIGTGGAARAIMFALARLGVDRVSVLARSPYSALRLLADFGVRGDAFGLDVRLPPVALLVNASSLGMAGKPPYAPDLSPLPDRAVVYDIVYAPLVTPLLAAAEARGLETIDGLEMLVAQAAIAFEILFEVQPPREHDSELRKLLTA